MEDFFKHLKPFEERRIVQLAAKKKDVRESVLLFQSENETIPYDFLKTVKFNF